MIGQLAKELGGNFKRSLVKKSVKRLKKSRAENFKYYIELKDKTEEKTKNEQLDVNLGNSHPSTNSAENNKEEKKKKNKSNKYKKSPRRSVFILY